MIDVYCLGEQAITSALLTSSDVMLTDSNPAMPFLEPLSALAEPVVGGGGGVLDTGDDVPEDDPSEGSAVLLLPNAVDD